MADVKTFPRARGWGLCSGIEQIWEEHVLDGEATLRYSLLMMIAQDHIDGRAVALDAIGPPVVTQKRAILVDQVAEPGQHDAHVVERHSLNILLLHAVLGSAEGAVDRLHETRMLVRKFAGHHHGVHDRENAGASVVIALHGFIILEQPSDLRRAFENCLRGIGRDERVDLASFQHGAKIDISADPFDFDAGWHRVRDEINGTNREIDAADDPAALFWFHAEIVGQNAFGYDPGVVPVKGEFADPLADKVLRLFDAAVSTDVDGTVPERADRKDGNRQKR